MEMKKETNEEKVFFVSVRDQPNTKNRKYSDLVRRLCQDALEKNRHPEESKFKIEPHDLRLNSSDLRADLSHAIANSKRFVILLDEWENDVFNPNVWFECGVISTINSSQITFIAKNNTRIPFDVGSSVNIVRISDTLVACMKNAFDVEDFDATSVTLSDASEVNEFKRLFKIAFHSASNPFTIDYEMTHLKNMGFNSLLDFFKETGIDRYLKPGNGFVEYIDGEEDAFTELTAAVKGAKKSLRTSRFAKQSIVDGDDCHVKFMNALKEASYRVDRFDRIICINEKDKWLDVWKALADFCPNKTIIYLRKAEFSIKFELVVIDEEISFIHFYLADDPPGENEEQNDEKIRSTLKIVGAKISKKLADIFDRLHHRDYNKPIPTELSRTLLGVQDIDGNLSEESKNHGFLRLQNNLSHYYNIPIATRNLNQQHDAEKAILEVNTWNLTEDDRKTHQEAVEAYFNR